MFLTRICTARDFQSDWFRESPALHDQRYRLHRKAWENAFVYSTIRAAVNQPLNLIGFGVGDEPLAKHLAAMGHQVLATDLQSAEWQHVHGGLSGMADVGLATRRVDMNWIENDVPERGFDACWSLCSMDHLGSVWLLKRFVLNSVNVLHPGCVAVHTAEYSFCPDMPRSGPTCYLNADDLIDLQLMAAKLGHHMAPIDWCLGTDNDDHGIDQPPYPGPVHIKVGCEGNRWTTSIGIAVRRGPCEVWLDVNEQVARQQVEAITTEGTNTTRRPAGTPRPELPPS